MFQKVNLVFHPLWQPYLKILHLINEAGYFTLFAGGCVRDYLLGINPHDFDLATNARPDQIIDLFKDKKGYKSIPTGIDHGTITVMDPQKFAVEITTLREDISTDGRRAKVRFGVSFCNDALRRDFTINGLYMDCFGHIYDFVGGVKDLNNQVLKFIGNPSLRIQEDHLRILRYYRFWAKLGWDQNPSQRLSIKEQRAAIDQLSRERVIDEFFRILNQSYWQPALLQMLDDGVLTHTLQIAPSELSHFRKSFTAYPIDHSLFISQPAYSTLLKFALILAPKMFSALPWDEKHFFDYAKTLRLSKNQAQFLWNIIVFPLEIRKPENFSSASTQMSLLDRIESKTKDTLFCSQFLFPFWRNFFPIFSELEINPYFLENLEKLEKTESEAHDLRTQKMPIDGDIIKDYFGNLIEPTAIGTYLAELLTAYRNGIWQTKAEGIKYLESLGIRDARLSPNYIRDG